jgi:hypothetical protein
MTTSHTPRRHQHMRADARGRVGASSAATRDDGACRAPVTLPPISPQSPSGSSSRAAWELRERTPPANLLDFLDRVHARCVEDWPKAMRSVLLLFGLAACIGLVLVAIGLAIGSLSWVSTGAVGLVGGGGWFLLRGGYRLVQRRRQRRQSEVG